jgi:hypothetical protein
MNMSRSTLAATKILHTGADALAAATGATPARVETTITTIRFTRAQWLWLRDEANRRAAGTLSRADASAIVRELVTAAMGAA